MNNPSIVWRQYQLWLSLPRMLPTKLSPCFAQLSFRHDSPPRLPIPPQEDKPPLRYSNGFFYACISLFYALHQKFADVVDVFLLRRIFRESLDPWLDDALNTSRFSEVRFLPWLLALLLQKRRPRVLSFRRGFLVIRCRWRPARTLNDLAFLRFSLSHVEP